MRGATVEKDGFFKLCSQAVKTHLAGHCVEQNVGSDGLQFIYSLILMLVAPGGAAVPKWQLLNVETNKATARVSLE